MRPNFEPQTARARMAALLGETWVDGATLGPTGGECVRVAPADEPELRAVLALASELGASVIPCGFGSKLGWTALTGANALLVSTRRLTGVLSHEPADGTLSARGGTPMAELRQAALAGGHALTPDVPAAERASLGGVLAAGQSAFDRERYGPVRHHVLGVRVLLADGSSARSGGQLVKNVTGFDLQRLYTGSHGSLCVILEAALRLFPAPECEAVVLASATDTAALAKLIAAARATDARPLALLAGAPQPPDARVGWGLCACLGGKPEAVASEVAQLRAAWAPCAVLEGAEAVQEREHLRERAFEAQACSWLRGSCPPTAWAQAVESLRRHLAQHNVEARLWVQPSHALIDAAVLDEAAGTRLGAVVAAWRADLTRLAGNLHWRNAPATQRTHAEVWGPAPHGLALMRALKFQLDPLQLFASGRLAGGL